VEGGCALQAGSAYSQKVQAWLREETIEWGSRIDADVAAKEKDTEAVKQERQRDLIKLKVVRPCFMLHMLQALMSSQLPRTLILQLRMGNTDLHEISDSHYQHHKHQ